MRHGVVFIKRKGGERKGDREKKEALSRGLFGKDEEENKEGGKEEKAEEELEAGGARIGKYLRTYKNPTFIIQEDKIILSIY